MRAPRRLLRIGLTGAIGAGKSAAIDAFRRQGCATLEADAVVHALYDSGELDDAVRALLGDGVFENGRLSRPAVARAVFRRPDLLRALERTVHPRVDAVYRTFVEEAEASEPPPRAIVNEVPLLFESHLEDRYDTIVIVTAPDAVRRARIAARGGLEGLAAREARLLPDDERIRRADHVIVNDGDRDDLDRAVAALMLELGV